ncbi:hypothetical protein SETIT_7G011300v2 [Setaria italica]|uniref:Methyltransferase n=1 Tax=Setaria italica TaxID=4555 RepID=A0A368RQU5_SETIT|nr:hypothetical protein SETIT_7G011300v2 [Setaria italica]
MRKKLTPLLSLLLLVVTIASYWCVYAVGEVLSVEVEGGADALACDFVQPQARRRMLLLPQPRREMMSSSSIVQHACLLHPTSYSYLCNLSNANTSCLKRLLMLLKLNKNWHHGCKYNTPIAKFGAIYASNA